MHRDSNQQLQPSCIPPSTSTRFQMYSGFCLYTDTVFVFSFCYWYSSMGCFTLAKYVNSSCIWLQKDMCLNFMVTRCINNTEPFIVPTDAHNAKKNAELLKHSKLDKNAPTCFGLHRNHLQGAKVSIL